MTNLHHAITKWFLQLTDREPMEVDIPPEIRVHRLTSKGMYFCRLDKPSLPAGRRIKLKATNVFPKVFTLLYGPDGSNVTKVVMTFHKTERGAQIDLERWIVPKILRDPKVLQNCRDYLSLHPSLSLTMTAGIVGCPHEEEEDFPKGGDCPLCPTWKGRQGSAFDPAI